MADETYMNAALSIARRGLGQTWPNPSVGCVVVQNNGASPVIVGRGWTQPGGRPHAEPLALEEAGEAARGATAYVSLEPCAHYGQTAPCTKSLIEAGVARVVSATEDPDPRVAGRGHRQLEEAGIDVTIGTGEAAAMRANAGHISRIRRGRPHVQLKLAVSANGMIGGAGRTTVRITGPEAGRAVHMMRAEADAIMIGIGTVLSDDPVLTCRLAGIEHRSPVRVVADSRLRTPLSSRLIQTAGTVPVWILVSEAVSDDDARPYLDAGIEIIRVPEDPSNVISLPFALAALAARGITRLMVEGGAGLAAALFRGNLVDEAVIFDAPETRIDDGTEALAGLDLDTVLGHDRYRLIEDRAIGPDRKRVFWRES